MVLCYILFEKGKESCGVRLKRPISFLRKKVKSVVRLKLKFNLHIFLILDMRNVVWERGKQNLRASWHLQFTHYLPSSFPWPPSPGSLLVKSKMINLGKKVAQSILLFHAFI